MSTALMLSLITSAIRIKLPANAFQCDFILVLKATKTPTKTPKRLKSATLDLQNRTAKTHQNKPPENKVKQKEIFLFLRNSKHWVYLYQEI